MQGKKEKKESDEGVGPSPPIVTRGAEDGERESGEAAKVSICGYKYSGNGISLSRSVADRRSQVAADRTRALELWDRGHVCALCVYVGFAVLLCDLVPGTGLLQSAMRAENGS